MESLLGVVLVAQLPSQQADVYFQHPAEEKVCESRLVKWPSIGAAAGECAETQGDQVREEQEPPKLTHLKRDQIHSSSEDLRAKVRNSFGIPSMIFAKLMLPERDLCNRPFYLEMDAGHRQTTHPHGPLSHLHFVSFPCKVDEFRNQPDSSTKKASRPVHCDFQMGIAGKDPPSNSSNLRTVQSFNVVHVLDSRLTGHRAAHTSTLWEVSAHLARALVTEEARVSYLSKQIDLLAKAQNDLDFDSILKSNLGCLLRDMFEGVKKQGYKAMWVNDCVLCHVCVFPKKEAPAPPSAEQALALLLSREELLEELAIDSAGIVRNVIEAASPTLSLGELMVKLSLPLSTLQRVSQHLVFWKKARVVEVCRGHTRVTVAPGKDMSDGSPISQRFHAWQQKSMRAVAHTMDRIKAQELSFSEVIAVFQKGLPLEDAHAEVSKNAQGVKFDGLLEWLIAEDLLVQLGTFCRFLPSRSRTVPTKANINPKIRSLFAAHAAHHFTENEIQLLASRAHMGRGCTDDRMDDQFLLFFCQFVVRFARAHVRIDGCSFEEFSASIWPLDRNAAERARGLLNDNKDIFVQYTCQC